MGYYSSAFVTFLLALFNLRLGWWLGNPGPAGNGKWRFGKRRLSTYDTAGPNFAARPIFAETLGLTDDKHPYVYLSDGGHFENLGLYEMVLRRCKMIVVSDGSADPDFGL
ncbi:MAG: acyltransferase, partial [Acidobacteria bacterium]